MFKLIAFVKNFLVDYYLYDFNHANDFVEKVAERLNRKFVVMNIGTKNYFLDSFGFKMGEKLKKLQIYAYGGKKREINGRKFLKTYKFIKEKHKDYDIVILDSVYSLNNKKPILIYKDSPIRVSFLTNKIEIGNAGILFNSFSYSSEESLDKTVKVVEKIFQKISQKI